MKTIAKCAAVVSLAIFITGPAAWAQGVGSNQGFGPNAAQSELMRYGYTDIHNLSPVMGWSADALENGKMVHVIVNDRGLIATFRGENQGNSGMQGSSSAEGLLSRYGYTDIHNVTQQQGWSADAMKNGQMVHIMLSDNGAVATFRGVNPEQGMQGSSGPYVENSGAGYNRNVNYGFLAARNELSQYGYTDITNLHPTQSWSADATKNGKPVHILLNDNGLVATFSGS